MKITITEIEASAEDLAANRSVADAIMDALSRICDTVANPEGSACTGDTAEQEGEEE